MSADESAANAPLAGLIALQEEDLRADQLRHRRSHLPERARLAELRSERERLELERNRLGNERTALAERQDALETEAREAADRIARIEGQVRSGAVASFRDQEAAAAEIAALNRRRSETEDAELEVMVELEPLDEQDAELGEVLNGLAGEAARVTDALAAAETAIDEELASAGPLRNELAASLDAGLLAEYERLRARLDGIGAARLVHGACSGCHLALPATELDALRHAAPGTIAHCEQCGRILVP